MRGLYKKRRRKIKVVNKRRLSIFISILLVITYPAIMLAMEKPAKSKNESFINVYIEQGDTLWDIAKENLPPKTDIRNFVHQIKLANDLDSALIREGDSIIVPLKP